MVAYLIGALVATYLFSRLTLWLTKLMGDTIAHILVGHGLCYVFAIGTGSFYLSSGSDPDPFAAVMTYTVPQLLWLGVDLLALKGRRARAKELLDVF